MTDTTPIKVLNEDDQRVFQPGFNLVEFQKNN